MPNVKPLLLCFVTLGIAACKSKGDGEAGGSTLAATPGIAANAGANVSALEATKDPAALGPGEAARYCEDEKAYVRGHLAAREYQRIACASRAGVAYQINLPDAEGRCRRTFDMCMGFDAGGGALPPSPDANDCAPFVAAMRRCKGAVIADVNACVVDSVRAIQSLDANGACRAFAPEGGTPFTPSSCVALEAKCPGLMSRQGM